MFGFKCNLLSYIFVPFILLTLLREGRKAKESNNNSHLVGTKIKGAKIKEVRYELKVIIKFGIRLSSSIEKPIQVQIPTQRFQ